MDWKIVVHPRPDLDAIAGIWLLKKFGEKKFPGIAKARIEFLYGELEKGKSADVLEKERILFVDCGKGRFDHHPAAEHPKDCAATLIAKDLGIFDDPALESILRFVLNNDLNGGGHPFDLARIIKLMHGHHFEDPVWVCECAMQVLEAKYHEQLSFFSQTKEEYEKADKEDVAVSEGRIFKVVSVVSDNENFQKYARYMGASVVIQKRFSGNVQIFANRRQGVLLYDVARMVRLEEASAKEKTITSDWKLLESEGKIEGAEEWYFHDKLQTLLNGCLTAPNVPPTRLPLHKLAELVKMGINFTHLPGKACPKTAAATGASAVISGTVCAAAERTDMRLKAA